MNYDQIQGRIMALCKLEGWDNVSPPPDYTGLANKAWHHWCWDSEVITGNENVTSIIGTNEYTLTGNYKAILDVTFNTVGLLKSSEEFERNLNPGWRVQANSTPVRWVLSGLSKVCLVPPPSTISTLNVRGVQIGADMAAGTDVPAIPDLYHEAIALKGAILHAISYASGEAMARVQYYQTQYDDYVHKARSVMLYGNERRKPEDA